MYRSLFSKMLSDSDPITFFTLFIQILLCVAYTENLSHLPLLPNQITHTKTKVTQAPNLSSLSCFCKKNRYSRCSISIVFVHRVLYSPKLKDTPHTHIFAICYNNFARPDYPPTHANKVVPNARSKGKVYRLVCLCTNNSRICNILNIFYNLLDKRLLFYTLLTYK